jgi:hypothetical protein
VKRVLVIAVLVPVVAALAVTGLILVESAQAASPRPAALPSQTVVFDCPGQHALVRPKSFILTCADGNAYFAKLAWTSWTPGLASAKGTLVLNDRTRTARPGTRTLPGDRRAVGERRCQGTRGALLHEADRDPHRPAPAHYDAVHHVGDRPSPRPCRR